MDITNFMTWFIQQFLNFISWFFTTLDSISMFGFSMLDFLLAMILLPVGVQLFIAIVKVPGRETERALKSSERANRKGSDHNAQSQNS